ncbi:MAG: hypothetical protein CM15mP120_10240 [Pseudomonadota bacterium]|nr:MAG: hypothetical protein CM15mP120_10240 [Pseudomonadota bacterium]
MFSTVGGGAGSIGDTTSLLNRGFAMASTDTGTKAKPWSLCPSRKLQLTTPIESAPRDLVQ